MFKILKVIILSLMVLFTFSACGGSNTASVDANANDNANNIKAESENPLNKKDLKGTKKVVKTIDIDLTKLSSTMVYSEVQQMVWHPEKYVGKVVKMNGAVSIYNDPNMGRTYYTCIIADATACCQQGIEFRLMGNKALPSSYKEGNDVIVVGEFNTYKEGEKVYCELINAKLL